MRRAHSLTPQDRKGTFRGPSMHATVGWENEVVDADVVSWPRFTRTASRTLRHPCRAMLGHSCQSSFLIHTIGFQATVCTSRAFIPLCYQMK